MQNSHLQNLVNLAKKKVKLLKKYLQNLAKLVFAKLVKHDLQNMAKQWETLIAKIAKVTKIE